MGHKVEHAIDLDTRAIVAVTVQGADEGDSTTIVETASAATEQLDAAQEDVEEPQHMEEMIGDKGYHSNQTMVGLDAAGIRSYIPEPDRGRRDWSKEPEAQGPVYRNRRRIRGARGRRLMCRRGEYVERSFAHLYETGGMRCAHLRGHQNILKRLLIHAGGLSDSLPGVIGFPPIFWSRRHLGAKVPLTLYHALSRSANNGRSQIRSHALVESSRMLLNSSGPGRRVSDAPRKRDDQAHEMDHLGQIAAWRRAMGLGSAA